MARIENYSPGRVVIDGVELNRDVIVLPNRVLRNWWRRDGHSLVIEDLDEIEPGALWADTKLGFDLGVRHHDAWVRSAIVTDIHWMARATRLFAWMIPGEARVFPLGELDQAKAWVAGDA